MLVSSKSFPEATENSTAHTLVLRCGTRLVLVLLPKTYQELLLITRAVFGTSTTSTFVFETSELDVCPDVAVEIHPSAWEAIALTLSTVVVKKKEASPRGGADSGVVAPQHPLTGRRSSLTPRRAHKAASRSYNEVTQSEIGPSASGTSYDDIQDVPTDDFGEEELGSHDDELDVAPSPRKGKGTTRSHPRIDSEDELEGGDEEGYVEALQVVKVPTSQRMRNPAEPSFSITPSSSKRIGTSPKAVRASRGLFSPARAGSSLMKPAPPTALSDEEQWEAKPPRAFVAVVPEAVPNTSPPKYSQNDDSNVQSEAKPPLRLQQVTPAPATPLAQAAAGDKLLITIRHPPTGKENKFKVKATHTVGRVLSSACVAFGLDPSGASLMLWSEEDGVEMSYPCENHSSMGIIATGGTVFTIELAK